MSAIKSQNVSYIVLFVRNHRYVPNDYGLIEIFSCMANI